MARATFGEIKGNVRSNLDDAGVTFYSADAITESLQDAYDDVAFQCRNIIRKITVPFGIDPYIDFSVYAIDYMGTKAIFNRNTNRWLLDCLTLRDFDKIRSDWELWVGTPLFWAAVDTKLAALVPSYAALPSDLMDLYYIASAPTIVDDDDTPLIATDFTDLLENYATADQLETAEEYTKAQPFWERYVEDIQPYGDRVKRMSKRDLLMIA